MGSTGRIKVLLIDDHRIVREGLHLLFESQPDMEVLGGTEVSKTLVQLAHELEPDVIVIDINMYETDNIELSRRVLNENPGIRIVVLPAQLHMHVLEQAIRAGISGFVLKECGFDELARAVRAVYENRTHMCPKIKDIIANGYLSQMQADDKPGLSALSKKEYEIIRLLSLGMTSKEIALRMDISPKTVDAYRRKIMYKLRINSMAELVKHAIRIGIASI